MTRRALLLVGLVACGDNAPKGTELVALPATSVNELDVLFVLTDGASVVDAQLELRTALPAMYSQISVDGAPDLHIAVVTSDMGTSALNGAPAPAIPGSVGGCHDYGDNGAFYSHTFATNIADANDLFFIGASGCGLEQELSAMRAAFVNPINAGFRRPEAALGVIVLADTEDCSALDPSLFSTDTSVLGPLQHYRCTQFGLVCDQSDMTTPGPRTNCVPDPRSNVLEDPQDFVDLLRSQAADPRRVAFGAVLAPTALTIEARAPSGNSPALPAVMHTCQWDDGTNDIVVADPSFRIAYVANQMGDRGAIGNICNDNDDGTAPMTKMGMNLRRAMGDPCVEDDVPLTSCTAVDELGETETPLSTCHGQLTNCFELVTDPQTCPNAAHQKLVVHHTVADATYTLLRC